MMDANASGVLFDRDNVIKLMYCTYEYLGKEQNQIKRCRGEAFARGPSYKKNLLENAPYQSADECEFVA